MKNTSNRIRPGNRQRQKMSRRTILLLSVFSFLLISGSLIVIMNMGNPGKAFAFSAGDYRAKATGNWNATTTWERYNGSAWVAAIAIPSDTVANIYIQSPYTVTVTANVSVDQVIVNSGATLILNSGVTLTVHNGTGTDLDVSGILKNAANININASAAIVFENGGKYQHNFTTTGGTIPAATWIAGSTCEIIGYTSNSAAPAGLQAFSNFTWNCPAQTADINLNGGLTTVNGNFVITTTNSKQLIVSNNTNTLSVGGNFTLTAGTFVLASANNANGTLNITGNCAQTGGTFSVVTGNNGNGTVNIYGNVSRTGGSLTVGGNGNTYAQVNFTKTGTQTYTSSGATITGNVDFTVSSGATLDMANYILGGRNFTLSSGAGLMIGSPAGITTSGATGNIQSSGTRSYNIAANYTYSGTSAQAAGNGLPATVNNLTINNSAGVTLSATTSVSGVLTLTSGIITTGANELRTTSNSSSAITGYSAASYVAGNLRRTVAGTGTYDFPVGTASNYELATVTLHSATPFTTILGTFTNSNPLLSSLPLVNIIVSGLTIDKMLNYGYWTLTPNLPMLSGTYDVSVNETGATNQAGTAFNYTLLKRANSLVSWQSLGTHIAGTLAGTSVMSSRTGLSSFSDFAVAYGEYLNFDNASLISGTDGQVNAIYKFPNVCYNVDAWVQVMSMSGGATLGSVDGTTAGYDEAWQPFVGIAPNTTSSILWKLMFKVAGTSTDTVMPYLTITGVDVDGNASLHESVEATAPYSYTIDNPSDLTVTNTGLGYKATAGSTDLTGIDTSNHQAMFQINYQNISSFQYRTGGTSTQGSLSVRQNCLYFKSFFSGPPTTLPVKLMYFKAKLNEDAVDFDWATATELNNNYFSVERSADGEHFEKLLTMSGAGNSTSTHYYHASDEQPLDGYSYYRLRQTDYDGHYSFSEIETVKNGKDKNADEGIVLKSIYPNPFTESFRLGFVSKSAGLAELTLLSSSGQVVASRSITTEEGYNNYEFIDEHNLQKGIYYAVLTEGDKKQIQKIIRN